MTNTYPTYEDHRKAWEELAAGIASIREDVREIQEGEILPLSKPGSLTIIGSGIETIGVALGDKKLIEDADKVLFCVADPATIVWLKGSGRMRSTCMFCTGRTRFVIPPTCK